MSGPSKSTRKRVAKREPRIFCLRVELEDITPLVWRRLWIGGDATLLRLHHVLQAAMGWTDARLHEFRIGGQSFAVPDPDYEFETDRAIVDERPITLDSVLPGISEFRYWYDFGDDWWHRIAIEESRPVDDHSPLQGYAEAGERACPPEDSGGIPGYQAFLDARAGDRHGEEMREFLEWAGEDFDPARFDRHAANAALLRMAWNRWGAGPG